MGQRESRFSSPKEDIASQLKAIRKAQGVTQQVLADRVGTKKSNISRFESGRYNPSIDFLVKVAAGLGREICVEIK